MKETISPGRQVFLLIALIIGGMVILSSLFFLLFAMIFGTVDFNNPESIENMSAESGLIMFFSSQLGLFVLAFWVFLKATGQKYRDIIQFSKWNLKNLGLVLGALIIAFFGSLLLADLNLRLIELMPDSGFLELKAENEERLLSWFSPANANLYPFALIVVAAMPAIVEELIFRGLLQSRLIAASNDNVHFGIIVSGTIFAALHMQPWNLLPMILLGVLFGYVYHYTKDIRYTMLMHFLHNGVQVTLMFFAPGVIE
jgi:membrane protease YdiL (CAAX protease family)